MSAERWIPARTISQRQRCDFCGCDIPRAKPGNTTGSRGTKAWFNPDRRVWECCDCRSEGFRAEAEREKLDEARRASAAQVNTEQGGNNGQGTLFERHD